MTRAELLAYIDSNVYPNANNEITALMVRDVLHRMVGFMGDAATYGVGDVAPSDPGLVTGGAVQGAINTALSSAIKFQGVTTTPLTDGSTDPDIVIAGDPYTARRGDEVIYGGREFLWTGSVWQQLGDEQSWALKTITISAGAGLVGGGDLTQNRTISLSQDSLNKLALAASAYQVPQGGIPKADLASAVQTSLGNADTIAGYFTNSKLDAAHLPDLYLARTLVSGTAANKTLYGVDGISHAAAADNTDKSRVVWDADNDAWHFYGNIYTDGWFSGGGISQGGGGGGGGIDPVAMWSLLGAPTSEPINSTHISFPVTSVVGLQGAVSAAQIAAALGLGSLAYKSSLLASDIPDLSGTYLPRSAGSNYPLTGDLYMGSHAISGLTTINGILDVSSAATYTILTGKSLRITDGASTPSTLTVGQWDGVYNRVETGGRPFLLTTYSQPIYIGREGLFIDITLDTSGNVAIGANSSSYKLYVNGTFNATTIYQNGVALGARAFDSTDYLPLAGGNMTGAITPASGQTAIAWSASSLTLNGAISGATNIDSLLFFDTTNSRVGVNTPSPQYALDVTGQINTNHRITIGGGLTIGWWDGTNNRFESYNRPLLFTSYSYPIQFGIDGYGNALYIKTNSYVGVNNTDPQYAFDVAGVIHATTGIWTDGYFSGGGLSQSSDARLKTAIKNFAYSSSLLMSLRPKEWDWSSRAAIRGHAAGFVAQDVEPLMPYSVDKSRNYLALFYEHFHAVEISALQDHERRIDALEKRFNVN